MENIDYTRYYSKWHSDEPNHVQGMIGYFSALIGQRLPKDKNARILDVGCGMGFALLAAKSLGYENVEGIELDRGQYESCIKKDLNVQLVTNSSEFLSTRNNYYDCILLLDVLEHIQIKDQLALLKNIHQSLTKDGVLICSVPNANSALAARWRYNDWTHSVSFTEHSLDFVLFNAGFSQTKIITTEFFTKPNGSLLLSFFSFKKSLIKVHVHWLLFRLFRLKQRYLMIAELGWEQGREIPLSLNLLSVSTK